MESVDIYPDNKPIDNRPSTKSNSIRLNRPVPPTVH